MPWTKKRLQTYIASFGLKIKSIEKWMFQISTRLIQQVRYAFWARWPGRLWIHATSKAPDLMEIQELEARCHRGRARHQKNWVGNKFYSCLGLLIWCCLFHVMAPYWELFVCWTCLMNWPCWKEAVFFIHIWSHVWNSPSCDRRPFSRLYWRWNVRLQAADRAACTALQRIHGGRRDVRRGPRGRTWLWRRSDSWPRERHGCATQAIVTSKAQVQARKNAISAQGRSSQPFGIWWFSWSEFTSCKCAVFFCCSLHTSVSCRSLRGAL